jgi:5-oxoprolinase (ATP-hydrolysing) subunit A
LVTVTEARSGRSARIPDNVPDVRVDLNADLGEGFGAWRLGDDEGLLDIVTSANVACGFHAGDPVTMQRVCAGAEARGVTIGAQVGYHDLVGFGRRRIEITAAELFADVLYQLGALDAFARAAGTAVRYVKPHGALYNTAADDEVQAGAVAAAVAAFDRSLPLLGLPDSALTTAAAAAGVPFVAEAFADRAYRADGRLVARDRPGAVLTAQAAVVEQAISIARDGRVRAVDGSSVPVAAVSLCVHGDTPGAVTLARAVRTALSDSGLVVAPFA